MGLVIYIARPIFCILYFSISGLYKRIINRHIALYIKQMVTVCITRYHGLTH